MNTLKFLPKKIRKTYEKNIIHAGVEKTPERYHNIIFLIIIFLTIISSTVFFFLNVNLIFSILVFLFLNFFFYFRISLKASSRIKKMEKVFPDVISLMASNLRSGVTIDRAFLLSARPEFDPLDKEILKTGKEIATGKEVFYAFKKMSERIDSEKIYKVVLLILSGLKAGGNISDLLEETSRNMKEKEVIEKKASSTILMYVIFIFFAVAVGAPVLFGLSSILVEIVVGLSSHMPDTSSVQTNLAFTFSAVPISVNFVIWFSLIFITITNLISCFVMGYVNKGEGKAGLKLFIPMIILSLGLFFAIRAILASVLVDAISIFN